MQNKQIDAYSDKEIRQGMFVDFFKILADEFKPRYSSRASVAYNLFNIADEWWYTRRHVKKGISKKIAAEKYLKNLTKAKQKKDKANTAFIKYFVPETFNNKAVFNFFKNNMNIEKEDVEVWQLVKKKIINIKEFRGIGNIDWNTNNENIFYENMVNLFRHIVGLQHNYKYNSKHYEDIEKLQAWYNVYLRKLELKQNKYNVSVKISSLDRKYNNSKNSEDAEEVFQNDDTLISEEYYIQKREELKQNEIIATQAITDYTEEAEEEKRRLINYIIKNYSQDFAESITNYLDDDFFVRTSISKLQNGNSGNLKDVAKNLIKTLTKYL